MCRRQVDAGTGAGVRRWGMRGAGARGSRQHRRAVACGRKRQERDALGARALGSTGARQAGAGRLGRGRARGLGVLFGPWVGHSLHSACFFPDLTQYGF